MARLPRLAACALVALVACTQSTSDTNDRPTTTEVIAPTDSPFEVTGTVTQAAADQAAVDPVTPPFTITVAERGVGGAEFDNITVSGKPSQINWGAGQPLPVTGTGAGFGLGVVRVNIDAKTITWSLDGAARDVLAGTYTLGSSVAVGAGGLGTPVDKVTFTAGEGATISTRGKAVITEPRSGPIRLEGRDSLLVLVGKLTLNLPAGDRKANRINFGPGAYEVTLTPVDGGYTVVAHLQGNVTTM